MRVTALIALRDSQPQSINSHSLSTHNTYTKKYIRHKVWKILLQVDFMPGRSHSLISFAHGVPSAASCLVVQLALLLRIDRVPVHCHLVGVLQELLLGLTTRELLQIFLAIS